MKQPELKIVYLPIEKIKPYKDNPRDNSKAIKKVAKSIKDFGFRVPLVLDKNRVIVTGHTRYFAAKDVLGLEKVPCIIAEDLSKEKIKAYRIADNKVAEFATWNESLLASEMDALKEMGFDLEDTGFSEIEIMELTEDILPEKYDSDEFKDYEEEANKKLKSYNVIICCRDEKEQKFVKKLLKEESKLKRTYEAKELKKRFKKE